MKKISQVLPSRKPKQQKGKPLQNPREMQNGNNIGFSADDIETDSAIDYLRTSHGDKQTQSHNYTNKESSLKVNFLISKELKSVNEDSVSLTSSTSGDSGISTSSSQTISSEESFNFTQPKHLQSDLHTANIMCSKHPQHIKFIPIFSLNVNNFPTNFRKLGLVSLIQLKAMDVVRLSVNCTSDNRPDELGFKGVTSVRYGSGTAFVYCMDKTELCDCKADAPEHSVSGLFRVMTASHVVFDDEEAKNTVVEFFYDSTDPSTIIRGWGVRVCVIDIERNRSIIECRTHDLNLCQRLKDSHRQRNEIAKELQSEVIHEQLAVLISHPHGMCKQVSFGSLKDKKLLGEPRMLTDGVSLVDCMLTYDTPTCPGAGGGPVNVIGGGMVSYAFAPHCASKSSGENISGLGWARV